MAAAMQARDAAQIESLPIAEVTEQHQVAHRAWVVGAVMQATAALECEIWEVMVYGPGHHLGSNGTDFSRERCLSGRLSRSIERAFCKAIDRSRTFWTGSRWPQG